MGSVSQSLTHNSATWPWPALASVESNLQKRQHPDLSRTDLVRYHTTSQIHPFYPYGPLLVLVSYMFTCLICTNYVMFLGTILNQSVEL